MLTHPAQGVYLYWVEWAQNWAVPIQASWIHQSEDQFVLVNIIPSIFVYVRYLDIWEQVTIL